VILTGRPADEAAALLQAAIARLDARVPGERGRARPTTDSVSRRALFSLTAIVDDAPVAVLDRGACLGSRRCGLCAEACPETAIDVSLAVPEVDGGACSACGRCVTECPADALHLTGASPAQIEAQLERALAAVSTIVFACASVKAVAGPGAAVIELPGLGILSAAWIIQARRQGAAVTLRGCGGPCCEGADAALTLADRILAEGVAITPTAMPGVLEHTSERCTLCGSCATVCPAGALTISHGLEASTLVHDPAACLGCPLCVCSCPEDALAVRRALDVARLRDGPIELMRAEAQHCGNCGAELLPQPTRRRVAELLGRAHVPLNLCASCAREYERADAATV
jgi:ferredoxin